MKKYTSVFMLYVRGILYPCLGTMIGIFIAQALLFWDKGLGAENLDWALIRGLNDTTVIICIGMLAANMCRAFSDRGGKMGNTILRLRISEKMSFWMSSTANALVFSLYFLLQGPVFLGFCYWYDPQVTALELLVSAYDHPIFHQFFPLEDLWQVGANILMIGGLSIACAAYPVRQRHDKHSVTTYLMVLAVAFYLFLQKEGDHLDPGPVLMLFFAVVYCVTVCLAGTMSLEVDDNG